MQGGRVYYAEKRHPYMSMDSMKIKITESRRGGRGLTLLRITESFHLLINHHLSSIVHAR